MAKTRRRTSSMDVKGGFRKPIVATFKKYMPRTSRMMATALKEAKKEVTIAGMAALMPKMAEGFKQPIGSNGLRVGPTKERDFQEQKIDTRAAGGTTYSSCYYMYRPKSTLKSPRQNYRFKTSIQSTFESNANTQITADVPVLHARAVKNNPDSDSKYTGLTIKQAFDYILRAETEYSSQELVDQELVIPESNMTVHLESVSAEMLLTNGDHASEVTIYDCVPQYDLGPTVYLTERYATGYMSPSWCWNQGLISESIELRDNLTAGNIGSKPSDSVTFSRAWTVIKRTKITMTPNSIHKHNLLVGLNKSIPYQKMAQVSSDGGSYGGMCPTILISSRGVPVTDNNISYLAGPSLVNVSCNMELRTSSNLNQSPQAIVYDNTN